MAKKRGTSSKNKIRLKAYDYRIIDKSARKNIETAERTGAQVIGPFRYQQRKSKVTVFGRVHIFIKMLVSSLKSDS